MHKNVLTNIIFAGVIVSANVLGTNNSNQVGPLMGLGTIYNSPSVVVSNQRSDGYGNYYYSSTVLDGQIINESLPWLTNTGIMYPYDNKNIGGIGYSMESLELYHSQTQVIDATKKKK